MDAQTLIERLSQPSKVPFVSWGGCGVYAYLVANALRLKGVEVGILFMSGSESDKDKWSNKMPESCGHCLIEYQGKYFDGEGEYKKEITKYEHRMFVDLPFVKKCLKQDWKWNPMFDRSTGIPLIRNHIKTILS